MKNKNFVILSFDYWFRLYFKYRSHFFSRFQRAGHTGDHQYPVCGRLERFAPGSPANHGCGLLSDDREYYLYDYSHRPGAYHFLRHQKRKVDLQAFGTGFALQKLRDLRCCGQDTAHAPVLFPCCASSCPVWTDPVDAGPLRNSLSGDCKRHGILLIFYHWMPFFWLTETWGISAVKKSPFGRFLPGLCFPSLIYRTNGR